MWSTQKPHGVRGLSKHYHIQFNTKLGHEILQIISAWDKCTYMLDKPWVTGLTPQQQSCYQPLHDFTYWPVLGCSNNWNIITLSYKTTTSEAFEKIHQVVLYSNSDNMDSLIQSGKYGSMNTIYSTTMV